jgi:tRNA dimethylallyltransferase
VEPEERFDVARFRIAAAAAIDSVHGRGRAALVVGGTGLYVRALLRGLCPAPPEVPALRAVLRRLVAARGASTLHRGLAALDPPAARRIDPHDAIRIVRALEVGLASGRRLSDWQAAHAFGEKPYDALVIGLAWPVPELDARIAARARAMVEQGFLEEVRLLRRRGVVAEAPAFRTVGYPAMLAWLDGRVDGEAALAAVVRGTRRFAKRQRTWFRREPDVVWRHPNDDRTRCLQEVAAFLTAGVRPATAAA